MIPATIATAKQNKIVPPDKFFTTPDPLKRYSTTVKIEEKANKIPKTKGP